MYKGGMYKGGNAVFGVRQGQARSRVHAHLTD
jgi:hypothetical protein